MKGERASMSLADIAIPEEDQRRVEQIDIEKGEVLFLEGDQAKALYIIRQGRIALQKTINSNGVNTRTVSLAGPGDMIGWDALIEQTHATRAYAEEPSQVERMPVEVIVPLLQQDAELAMQFGKMLTGEIARTEDTIHLDKTGDVIQKVANALMKHLRFADEKKIISATQEQVAEVAGVSRESLSSIALNSLERRGLTTRVGTKRHRKIKVLKPNKMVATFNLARPRR